MDRVKLINKLDKLNEQTKSLFADLRKYRADQLFKKPASDVWSPMQILFHLYKSEMLSLKYIKKKVQYNGNLKTSGLLSILRSWALGLGTRFPLKYRAIPQVRADQLPNGLTLESIEKDWEKIRDDLRQFLFQIDESLIRKNLYRHPIAGRLNLYQMLQFFNDHLLRHKKQIFNRLEIE